MAVIFNLPTVLFTDVAQPIGHWKAYEVASVGELLLDISIQLAKQ